MKFKLREGSQKQLEKTKRKHANCTPKSQTRYAKQSENRNRLLSSLYLFGTWNIAFEGEVAAAEIQNRSTPIATQLNPKNQRNKTIQPIIHFLPSLQPKFIDENY
ncbi:uncharacterized protein H6S33_011081 [Morchella sextelata]|uniref:uncharacterized protein n=1 Tax=Morchella sextelata TaxID=1174677 RepID=UPI001D03E2AB|nr:uncharacterized protein H6S33_011081 [Morchella sextelata]KAH0611816.1 hypothetical protein H6S33_011081 [Morchella sextelata]